LPERAVYVIVNVRGACMARTQIRGSQVRDESITDRDLARDSVITEKIKDGNVTCPKLAPGICDRLLNTDNPIGRIKVTETILQGTDFTIPGGLTYDINYFMTRVAIYRNGQLLFNGLMPPTDKFDPTDVYPGSDNTKIKFECELRKGETVQVVIL
jgi:hypothetical protein